MVEIITYSLRDHNRTSDRYYLDIASFTDRVIDHARQTVGGRITDFIEFIQLSGLETPRSEPEYILEFYLLGTLYANYSSRAAQIGKPSQRILTWLYNTRQKHRSIKSLVDFFRGILGGLFLSMETKNNSLPISYAGFTQLLAWMQAAGDFPEEIKRLTLWKNYLQANPDQQQNILQQALSLAEWFSIESEKTLGQYTSNVEQFLEEKHPAYQWREDRFFCGRQRVEYHLNMVGTEILNRSFRDQFLNTTQKIVLLPPCMKAKQDGSCQAEPSPFGDLCGHCTPGCRIHQVTLLGDKHGFSTVIIPHELSVFSSGKVKTPDQNSLGIIGVSCPVTNVTGGWETKDLGVPAQGVLLDYCGCHWHWHPDGIPTDINLKQLLQTIGID